MICWHVDYWDYIGWKDRFGSKDYSERQRRYRALRELRTMGTPQFFIGSEALPWVRGAYERIPGLVEKGAKEAPKVRIKVSAQLGGGKVAAKIKLDRIDAEWTPGKTVRVIPVLYQGKAETNCTAGENKGRRLVEYHSVVKRGKPLSAKKALEKELALKLDAPKGVEASNLGLAVLVEDQAQLRTLECVAVPVR